MLSLMHGILTMTQLRQPLNAWYLDNDAAPSAVVGRMRVAAADGFGCRYIFLGAITTWLITACRLCMKERLITRPLVLYRKVVERAEVQVGESS